MACEARQQRVTTDLHGITRSPRPGAAPVVLAVRRVHEDHEVHPGPLATTHSARPRRSIARLSRGRSCSRLFVDVLAPVVICRNDLLRFVTIRSGGLHTAEVRGSSPRSPTLKTLVRRRESQKLPRTSFLRCTAGARRRGDQRRRTVTSGDIASVPTVAVDSEWSRSRDS
jgi:hypothetical protein